MGDPLLTYAEALTGRIARAEAQRAALIAAIESTRTARSLDFADDEHDPDGSLASLDQARDSALLERTEQTLADLAAAQRRLEDGSYGVCEVCGRAIAPERLLARPETRDCITCAERSSRRGRHHRQVR